MIDQLYDKATERFIKHFGNEIVNENEKVPMTDSINMKISNVDGASSFLNSKRVIDPENPKELVYEGDIQGDLALLEKEASTEKGRKVTLRQKIK